MIKTRTKRANARELKKLAALAVFKDNEILSTNQVAVRMRVGWPVADRALYYLVEDGKLIGNTATGYSLRKDHTSLLDKLKRLIHG
jgi:DNA-binding transcriptional regulator YhcF (GntR family)